MIRRTLILAAITFAALAFSAPSFAAAPAPFMLFVLAGQSNMAGALLNFGHETPTPNVFDVSLGAPKPAVDPLGDQTQAGPGIAIGAELHRLYPDVGIGLIQCAVGATPMIQWTAGGTLYNTCLQRIEAARAYGTVQGIFFYQGEYETFYGGADAWSSGFAAMVAGFRVAVTQPSLPVVFAQLGRTPSNPIYPYWQTVKGQQASVRIPGVRMIVTDDIPSDVHYTAAGYAVLGARFADAFALVHTLERWRSVDPGILAQLMARA
ncbi:MAG: sialate O-acetylesterase [Gaiellaceae bacterium]